MIPTLVSTVAPAVLKIAIPKLWSAGESLVLHVEKLFGSKTGPTKFETVVNALAPIANALSTAGIIPGVLDGSGLGSIVETIVQDLKRKEQLTPDVVLTPPVGGTKFAVSGNLTLTQ